VTTGLPVYDITQQCREMARWVGQGPDALPILYYRTLLLPEWQPVVTEPAVLTQRPSGTNRAIGIGAVAIHSAGTCTVCRAHSDQFMCRSLRRCSDTQFSRPAKWNPLTHDPLRLLAGSLHGRRHGSRGGRDNAGGCMPTVVLHFLAGGLQPVRKGSSSTPPAELSLCVTFGRPQQSC
jgi:hypothetical protein